MGATMNPRRSVGSSVFENEPRETTAQPGALDERQERSWGKEASFGVHPACEALHPTDGAVFELDNDLVVGDDLAILKRAL